MSVTQMGREQSRASKDAGAESTHLEGPVRHCACASSAVQLLTGTLTTGKGPSVASRSVLAPLPISVIRYLQDLSHNGNFVVSTKAHLSQVFSINCLLTHYKKMTQPPFEII